MEQLDAQLQPVGTSTIDVGARRGSFVVAGSRTRFAVAWFTETDTGAISRLTAQVFDGTYGPTQVLAPSAPLPGEQLFLTGEPAAAEHDGTLDLVWTTDSERTEQDTVHTRYELVRTLLQRDGHTVPATFE